VKHSQPRQRSSHLERAISASLQMIRMPHAPCPLGRGLMARHHRA
jgi:hypothetical protein